MTTEKFQFFACDLCGNTDAVELPHSRDYTGSHPLHICTNCGLVYVKQRRTYKQIADDWSDRLFGTGYTAVIPATKARLTYVAEFLKNSVDLQEKKVCDIGAGEGVFLDFVRKLDLGTEVFGVEPSKANCGLLAEMNIDHFVGAVEDYRDHIDQAGFKPEMDVVTIMWTLECSQSPRSMLDAAYNILKDDGYILIATGSRIMVPFKKPLSMFLSKNEYIDIHPVHFSANTLCGILAESGFETTHINRYLDTDYLVVVAKKVSRSKKIEWEKDNYLDVYTFFERWHSDTQLYYAK